MNISFKLRGIDEVIQYLKTVPYGAMKVGLRAVTEYIVGNAAHGLRHQEPYKYVTRKSAYGMTFFTEKQRRWFWANGGPDMIGNNRTGNSAKAWTFKELNNGYFMRIENPTAAAYYQRDNSGQARQLGKVGWRKIMQVVTDNMAGAIRHANAEIKKYLGSK